MIMVLLKFSDQPMPKLAEAMPVGKALDILGIEDSNTALFCLKMTHEYGYWRDGKHIATLVRVA